MAKLGPHPENVSTKFRYLVSHGEIHALTFDMAAGLGIAVLTNNPALLVTMTSEVSDAKANRALTQARNGIGAGFEYLFNELAGPVAAFAARRGSEDPDGVANTALFDAYKGLATFDGDFRAFRAYVFRIARNRMIDDYRKQVRRPRLAELKGDVASPVCDGTDERLGSDEWVGDMLAQLTDDQREVIVLRVLSDLSIDDTAIVMDKPVTAVKALQRRAIRRLHKLTGEEVHS